MRNAWMDEKEQMELIRAVLRYARRIRLTVTGPSMVPTIRSGDALEVRPFNGIAKRGSLYLFQEAQGSRLYAHRLVRREGDRFIFKGDELTLPDAPVPAAHVLGEVTGVWRLQGFPYRLPLYLPGLGRLSVLIHTLRPWARLLARKVVLAVWI